MSYQEWRRRFANDVTVEFWAIIDFNWICEEQNELARLWKAWAPE